MRISRPSTFIEEWSRGTLRDPGQHFRDRTPRDCPICEYSGYFISAGTRQEARCPNCSSKERDRKIQLYLRKSNLINPKISLLHFSPERPFWRRWKNYPHYTSGDIKPSRLANTIVDIEKMQFPDDCFDVVLCNHILEHVNHPTAGITECFRVMKPAAVAIFSVPMDLARAITFEPPPSMPKAEIQRLCGKHHARLYGLDFPDKLLAAGFTVDELSYSSAEIEKFRLEGDIINNISNDRVFVAKKPRAVPGNAEPSP